MCRVSEPNRAHSRPRHISDVTLTHTEPTHDWSLIQWNHHYTVTVDHAHKVLLPPVDHTHIPHIYSPFPSLSVSCPPLFRFIQNPFLFFTLENKWRDQFHVVGVFTKSNPRILEIKDTSLPVSDQPEASGIGWHPGTRHLTNVTPLLGSLITCLYRLVYYYILHVYKGSGDCLRWWYETLRYQCIII